MAETMSLIDNNIPISEKPYDRENAGGESADKSPFRRIEFHPARKPFTGFSKGSGADGGFRLETLNPTTTSSKSTRDEQQRVGSDSAGGGSLGKKRDASELENGLDPELSFGITFRRIGAGLENLGNTCFLNSVLQCLTYTEPLAAYLQSGKHQITCRNAGFCALCAIQKHVSRALQSSGRSLAPKDLVSNLRCISRTFRNSRQEDAHEYMVNLLESMHKCCLPKGVPSESPSAHDRSLVHKIFGGRLRSQVKCMQCNYCSNKFDPFLDLSLEILKADNLYKAFANFTAKEQLDGGGKQYQCQQCKQKVKALKQLTIHKAPNVLTIHLKRFGSHISGQKIDKKIQFGPTLDLKPFVTGPDDRDLKYTLYGVLVHAGWSTHSGHYYCFVRTSSGMWYSLDDNRVIQVSEKKVFEQKAYMLFYFRDRKNVPSKKPADVVHQREKMANNVGRNNTHPVISEGKGRDFVLSNGTLNGPSSLAAVISAPKETLMNSVLINGTLNTTNAPKETEMKEGMVQKSILEAQLDGSQKTAPQNGATEVNGGVSIDKNRDVLKHDDAMKVENASAVGNAILSSSSGLKSSKKEVFSAMLPKCKEKQSTNGDLGASTAVTKPLMTPGNALGVTEKTCPEKESARGESFGASGGDDCQKGAAAVVSSYISKLPKMESSPGHKAHKKSKKNLLKCKVTSMKFSSNILMGASFNQRKKKKHKRSDKSKSRAKNLAQENLIDEGPSSSSIKVNPVSPVNGVKHGSKIDDKNTDILVNSVEKEFKERVDKDGTVLATSTERNFNGATVQTQLEVKGTDGLSDCWASSSSTQKELVHMLTRGLDDRIVPRWDDKEKTPSQLRQTKGALCIGYVGDEWDEEYDRGKRKKVRISRTEFDGKNPFQEIANERLKLHAAKQRHLSKKSSTRKHKSSSGNRPFRI